MFIFPPFAHTRLLFRPCGVLCNRALCWLLPWLDLRLSVSDVLDMVDVLVEGSEGLDEEIGVVLNEDMALLTFPFSSVVPAALEARNKLLLGTENAAGTLCSQDVVGASDQLGVCGVGGGIPGSLEMIAENPEQQAFRPTTVSTPSCRAKRADRNLEAGKSVI